MVVHERKIKNYLLQPLWQIRLGLYSIGLSLVFSAVMGALVYRNFYRFYQLVIELTDLRDDVEVLYRTICADLCFGLP